MEINALKQRSRFRKYEADWQASRRALFLQGDQSVANQAGAAFRADMNNELQAIVSNSSGASSPSTTYAYQWWADTTNGLMKQRNAANTGWVVRGTLAETFLIARASNTIIGVGDYGRTFDCTGSFTQTFTAVATLGDGFWCEFRNSGTGVITFDPNASETIDGVTTLALNPGESCIINCNGSALRTLGRHDINALTEDTAPDPDNDFIASYSASAVGLKKIRPGLMMSARTNFLINGGCEVAQRAVPNISTTPQYGKIDRFACWSTGTAVSAGTVTNDTAATIGRTGNALFVSGLTVTGTGIVFCRQRIESVNAVKLKNAVASFAVEVLHDVGSSINYTVTVRKPTVADNYGAATTVATSSAQTVATATATTVKFENISLGDVSNGIEIEVSAACGAVTTKNFRYADFRFCEGAVALRMERRHVSDELALCQRYFEKSYDPATAPGTATATGSDEFVIYTAVQGPQSRTFKVSKRAAPTITFYSVTSGSSGFYRNITAGVDDGFSTENVGISTFSLLKTTSSAAGSQYRGHWTADCEL